MRGDCRAVGGMHSALELLKARRRIAIEGDNLAVEDECPFSRARKAGERRDDLRKLRGLRVALSAEEGHRAIRHESKDAYTVALHQEPLRLALAVVTVARSHEGEDPTQSLAEEAERYAASMPRLPEGTLGIFALGQLRRLIGATIPEHDGAAAVLTVWDDALERVVFDWMIFDLYREPLVGGIQTRPLRHCPALHHATDLQSEIVVEMAGGVLLHHERERAAETGHRHAAARLGGDAEV